MSKVSLVLFLIHFWATWAWGQGVSFEAAIGSPEVTLQNPTGGVAVYSGLAVTGRLYAPIYTDGIFTSNFVFSGRYVDLNNNSNSPLQRETGNHIGLGGGLHFKIYRIVTGASYHLAKGRHFWVGDTNNQYTEFDYNVISYYMGLEFMFSKAFGLTLSYETATADMVVENNDVPYKENTLWLHFRFNTGDSVGGFLGKIFAK